MKSFNNAEDQIEEDEDDHERTISEDDHEGTIISEVKDSMDS